MQPRLFTKPTEIAESAVFIAEELYSTHQRGSRAKHVGPKLLHSQAYFAEGAFSGSQNDFSSFDEAGEYFLNLVNQHLRSLPEIEPGEVVASVVVKIDQMKIRELRQRGIEFGVQHSDDLVVSRLVIKIKKK